MKYDCLIVGAGLYGATAARLLSDSGHKVLVIDRRDHVAGNAYTEKRNGIDVHVYGAHIFHTNDDRVWEFVNRFASFNDYVNMPIADYHGEQYHLPFNMNTFREMWGVTEPEEAKEIIESQIRAAGICEPANLEEQAISMVGKDIYLKLVKGYTEKQWGRSCRELPPSIIRRLPVRFTYDNNYFNAVYQGIPEDGYTEMVRRMLEGTEVILGKDYLEDREYWDSLADVVLYTGAIDELYGYRFGELEYRSLSFENEVLKTSDYQGHAVMNYTDSETPYTRIIEHKWFSKDPKVHEIPLTEITREYPREWNRGSEPYYPVNDKRNNELYERYLDCHKRSRDRQLIGGRLGDYRYYDMDVCIGTAMAKAEEIIKILNNC